MSTIVFCKVTTWERIETNCPPEYIVKLFELGLVKNSNDLLDTDFILHGDIRWDEMVPGEEQHMSVEDNGGKSTIEIYTRRNDNILWENGK